jgi:hypothetical protein
MQDEALFQGGELHCFDLSQFLGISESLDLRCRPWDVTRCRGARGTLPAAQGAPGVRWIHKKTCGASISRFYLIYPPLINADKVLPDWAYDIRSRRLLKMTRKNAGKADRNHFQ